MTHEALAHFERSIDTLEDRKCLQDLRKQLSGYVTKGYLAPRHFDRLKKKIQFKIDNM